MTHEELAEVWRKRLDDFAQSGLNVRKWCERQGFSKNQYTYWRRRLANSSIVAADGTAWLPVQVLPDSLTPTSSAHLTVRIAGAEIDLSAGFDPSLLRAIVTALGSQGC